MANIQEKIPYDRLLQLFRQYITNDASATADEYICEALIQAGCTKKEVEALGFYDIFPDDSWFEEEFEDNDFVQPAQTLPHFEFDKNAETKRIDMLSSGESVLVQNRAGNIYKIKKWYDEFQADPRENFNLGTMVCWHNRYTLGDVRPAEKDMNPLEWLADRLFRATSGRPLYGKPVYDYLLNGQCELVRIVYDEAENALTIQVRNRTADDWEEYSDPYHCIREKENMDYPLIPDWFLKDCCEALSESNSITNDCMKILESMGFVFLPLYLYDHSGLAMSTTSFNDKWDSGQVGWIYANPLVIKDQLGEDASIDDVKETLRKEVKVYDKYLSGEAYGIVIERFATRTNVKPQEAPDSYFGEEDNCWGFVDAEDMVDFIAESIGEYTALETED